MPIENQEGGPPPSLQKHTKLNRNYKTCAVCGKAFADPPTNATKCCSSECLNIHRKNLHKKGVYNESVGKMLDGKRDFWDQHQGEQHINAKHWVIQSPDGKTYEIDNLFHFIKSNPDLFDGTPKQAFDGFATMKSTATGQRKKNLSYSWKGWKLLAWKEERSKNDKNNP